MDLSQVADGVYSGSYAAIPVAVEVQVTVQGQKITDIKLIKHDNGQGKPAEAIIDQVMTQQTLDVDVIAGATYSSKAILKSIELALTTESASTP